MYNCETIDEALSISLNDLQFGKSSKILDINTDEKTRKRMECMGIRVNKSVKKISVAPFKGPAIIEIEGCKLAIERITLPYIIVKN